MKRTGWKTVSALAVGAVLFAWSGTAAHAAAVIAPPAPSVVFSFTWLGDSTAYSETLNPSNFIYSYSNSKTSGFITSDMGSITPDSTGNPIVRDVGNPFDVIGITSYNLWGVYTRQDQDPNTLNITTTKSVWIAVNATAITGSSFDTLFQTFLNDPNNENLIGHPGTPLTEADVVLALENFSTYQTIDENMRSFMVNWPDATGAIGSSLDLVHFTDGTVIGSVNAIAPEPASLAVLTLGSLLCLRRQRQA